jgi:hypothetical protein
MAAMLRYEFIALHSVLRAIAVKKELMSDALNYNAKNEEARSFDRAHWIIMLISFLNFATS